MTCEIKRIGNLTVIACGRNQYRVEPPCSSCGTPAPFLCDWPLMGPKLGQTCSRPICGNCAVVTYGKPNEHLCPPHARVADQLAAELLRKAQDEGILPKRGEEE